jgi:hypothetical protein
VTQGKIPIYFGIGLKDIEGLSKRNMKTELTENA